MAQVLPHLAACEHAYKWNWPGDVRTAQCLLDAGVQLTWVRSFHSESPPTILEKAKPPPGSVAVGLTLPPVSFHHVGPGETQPRMCREVAILSPRFDPLVLPQSTAFPVCPGPRPTLQRCGARFTHFAAGCRVAVAPRGDERRAARWHVLRFRYHLGQPCAAPRPDIFALPLGRICR